MRPEFGCRVHDHVFAPINAATAGAISNDVRSALEQWEPRIDVLRVTATAHADAPDTLLIEVDFRTRANNAAQNIVYPFYLGEGPA